MSATDRDFDPSAELLVHDYDDERTLEEEETLYPEDDSQAELSSLQKVGLYTCFWIQIVNFVIEDYIIFIMETS
jgi:hypothetical protein